MYNDLYIERLYTNNIKYGVPTSWFPINYWIGSDELSF